ncbi:MAG TPA: flagellar basal-body rod protein FlgF [Steroidobacteraceae bacterium]|jgi:flagellar basal-body rod protein FlgF
MDKLLYVAMSGAKETLRAQAANSHNLANANTTGFKADLSAFQSRAVTGPGYASRVYATDSSVGWDRSAGAQITTGNPFDVAVQGPGFIAVQDAQGNEAYTRGGDLHVDPNGQLMTAAGLQVLGDNGPVSVPPFSSATVGPNGTISIVPLGQTPQTISNVGRIKLVNPPSDTISRSADGLFRTSDGQPAVADASTTIASGVLEGSNVDLAGSMVNMIELSRNFDLQIKALHAAEDNGSASAKLLQSS